MHPHVAETLGAERTLVLVLAQVLEASLVQGVPTCWQPHTFFSRREHLFQADWAVV